MKLHHEFFSSFSPMKCCLLDANWQQLKQETVGWLQTFSHMTSSQKKFRTEYKQWPCCPLRWKLHCRISKQGALYNWVAIAFGDMLVKGGGVGGGEGVICNLLGIISSIWLLSINGWKKPESKTSVFLCVFPSAWK